LLTGLLQILSWSEEQSQSNDKVPNPEGKNRAPIQARRDWEEGTHHEAGKTEKGVSMKTIVLSGGLRKDESNGLERMRFGR